MKRLGLFLLMICCVSYIYGYTADVSPRRNVAESGTCGDNLTWTLIDSVLTISGTGAMDDWGDYSLVPWYSSRTAIKSVIIVEGVTSIGNYAFNSCWNLISVDIPNGVATIGNSAFRDCYRLESASIPNSVTTIGSGAFGECYNLISLTIPSSVVSIGDMAFEMVPYVIYFGSATGAPWGTRSLNGYVEEGLVYEDSTKLTLLACSLATSGAIVIPEGVTSIGDKAFYFCQKITSVEIPSSVKKIGSSAFGICSKLISVKLHEGLKNISYQAFYGCSGLKTITIPNSIRNILDYAFYDCGSLATINIPDSVTYLGEYAFYGCSSLTSVVIPNSVNIIRRWAFQGCGNLSSVKLPQGVKKIFNGAFYGCPIRHLHIPASIDTIGTNAFNGVKLSSVQCLRKTPPALGENAFYFLQSSTSTKVDSLYVPSQSVMAYENSSWATYFRTINEIVYGESEVDNISNTEATLTWEAYDEVAQYKIDIYVGNAPFARYIVNGTGQVVSSQRFSAPSIYQQKQDTTTSSTDYFVISLENLTPGTDYTYTIEGTDATSKIVYYGDGSFSTTGYPTSIPLITTPFENKQSQPCKIFKDGQLYIIIDDKIYLLTGQEIK